MVKISLNENVSKLKEKSKAKNTQDKYQGDWLKFIDYCKNKYNCSPLDVDDLDSAYALTANYMIGYMKIQKRKYSKDQVTYRVEKM